MSNLSLLINDDSMWLKSLHGDREFIDLLMQLPQGTPLRLEIEGNELAFEKMRDGKDGRPTQGFKPVGESREIWKEFRDTRRGQRLPFQVVERKSSYLSSLNAILTEWDSEADEAAFRDL